MEHDRLAMTGRLGEPHVPRYDSLENLPGEIALDLVPDLERETRPTIEHRQDDSIDPEAGIEPLPNQLHGLEQVSEPLERIELALKRNDHPIGSDQGIDGQEPERRRTIDDDVVVTAVDRGK